MEEEFLRLTDEIEHKAGTIMKSRADHDRMRGPVIDFIVHVKTSYLQTPISTLQRLDHF